MLNEMAMPRPLRPEQQPGVHRPAPSNLPVVQAKQQAGAEQHQTGDEQRADRRGERAVAEHAEERGDLDGDVDRR
jgi:hypothetical protein